MTEHAAQEQPVPSGTACLGCRYDLGGLARTGACPECALAVAETVDWRWLGLDPLVYRRRLALACTLVWSSSAVLLLLVVAFGLVGAVLLIDDQLFTLPASPLSWLPLGLVTLELCVGWWFLSAPSPLTRVARGRDGLQVSRSLNRLLVISSTVLIFGGISALMVRVLGDPASSNPVLRGASGPTGEVFLGVAFLASLLGTLLTQLSGIWYLTRLATRLDAQASQYAPGSLSLSLRQTGWIPVYAAGGAVLAVLLTPVAVLMVGFFGVVPIVYAIVCVTVIPGAMLFALARSVWLVARFGQRVRGLKDPRMRPAAAVHSAKPPALAVTVPESSIDE